MYDDIRTIIASLATGLLAFLHPIGNFMVAAFIILGLNYFFGLTADIISGKSWSFKKSMIFFKHAVMFFGLAFFIFAIGHYMNNEKGAVQCVSFFCYAGIYFFGTNILRNSLIIVENDSPMGKLLDFVYYFVSLKFVEKFPQYTAYCKNKKDKNNGKS